MNFFPHEDLELKRHFLAKARTFLDEVQDDDDQALAYELAAALLYMNVADYIAEYIARNVQGIADYAIERYYLGSVSVRRPVLRHQSIEDSIKQLKKYDFSNREKILEKLDAAKKERNTLAHEILKTPADELIKIDEAVRKLRETTEELINMADNLQLAMPPKNLDEIMNEPRIES